MLKRVYKIIVSTCLCKIHKKHSYCQDSKHILLLINSMYNNSILFANCIMKISADSGFNNLSIDAFNLKKVNTLLWGIH